MAKEIEATEDRLSDLPDSILIHILSMSCNHTADSKKVVRTSVLSKRWQFLWMSVPVSLEIGIYKRMWERDVCDYVNSIHRELHYWGRFQKIKKIIIEIRSKIPEEFVKDVDLWVYFASKLANVEHFKLKCRGGYKFPEFAYKSTSWRKLDMYSCTELNSSTKVNWSSLISLSIGQVYLTDGDMEKVLSGCPNLECLELNHFRGFHHLEISNVKSRKLIIENLDTDECDVWLEIIAPYIQKLEIWGSCRGIYLRNVASLVTAVLDFDFDFEFEEEDPLQRNESTCVKELLHNVAHVEKLELGHWCIQYLSILELEGWRPPPSSWKFLQLTSTLKKFNFCGICHFLQSSSYLETLIIDGYTDSRDHPLRYTNTFELTKRFETHDFNCSFLHLKTIKIINFSGSMMPLVKYLLKHATVLEKFIIAARHNWLGVSPDYVKMEQELLSFPRSSPHASVIFSYRTLGPYCLY